MANEGARRRLGKREQAHLRARIIDSAGRVTDAWIKDISATGVRLETMPYVDIPKRFTLRFHKQGNREDVVDLVWRRGTEIGARFVTNAEPTPPVRTDTGAQVKKVSLEQLRSLARGGRA
jgi:hypothetical protein